MAQPAPAADAEGEEGPALGPAPSLPPDFRIKEELLPSFVKQLLQPAVKGQLDAAAALSQSKTIGIVGPVEVGDAQLYVEGFKAGAEANASGANVLVNYTGSFSDVALAAEAANAHIAAGAATVLDHDRLSPSGLQLNGQQSPDNVS